MYIEEIVYVCIFEEIVYVIFEEIVYVYLRR